MKNVFLALVAIITLHLFLLINLRFTAWPEMLLWPYLMINGLLPYKDIAIAHTPGLLLGLATFYKFFGVGVDQLRVFTWIVILLSDFLVFFLTKRLWSKKVALISVAFFTLLMLIFDANGMWFDLILVPLGLVTFFLIKKKNYFWAGVTWALMFFTKQTAFWFLPVIVFEIYSLRKNRKLGFAGFAFGAAIIFLISIIALWSLGLLSHFYNWAINFGIFTLPRSQGQIQIASIKTLLICAFPFMPFLPLLLSDKKKNLSLLVWAFVGALGAYPRFEYFHLLPAIPFISISSGILFSKLPKHFFMKVYMTVFVLGLLYLFMGYFIRNYKEGIRFYEDDVKEVTMYLKNNTSKNDRILVVNWWDNLYAFSSTIPATIPWAPQLEWYQELEGVQEMEIGDLESSKAKMIILKPYTQSGLSAYIPERLYSYIKENYVFKERVDGVEVWLPKK